MKMFIMRIYLCHISSCADIFSIHIFLFYFYFPFIYLSRICIYILCVRVCARVYVISQFQGNISASRENKIYNRNKVESKNKIHDVEMKFIRKLRIAKAPAEKCHETRSEKCHETRNQCSFASALLRSYDTIWNFAAACTRTLSTAKNHI